MNLDLLFPEFNDGVKLCLAFFCSFIITFLSIPIIVRVSIAKNLFAIPNRRTSHKHATPTLGGIAMFAGVLVSSLLFVDSIEIHTFQYVIAGSFVLFFFGIKDDLMPLSWKMKIFGEIVAAFFLIVLGNFRITDLHGILGFHQINYLSSTLITLFVMIGIVNAMNLIDGIDGLAAGLAFMATCIFGVWFFMTGQIALAIISISVTGMLLAYLGFNVFGTTNKIFMGDTGALLLGYLMTMFVIVMNQHTVAVDSLWYINNTPIVSFAILFIPLFDTLRVMAIRLMKGKSPFTADRNHIHHRILRLGFNHKQTTMILLLTNGLFIFLVFMLQDLEIYLLMLVIFSLGIIKSLIPAFIGRQMHYRVPQEMQTFKNVSKEVAKSIKQNDVRIKN
jgi:UDP-N-acetylmuramyl pentapeptide phosphotransferase/UDP-N-acetylglucosamine-1-phosphate transferase